MMGPRTSVEVAVSAEGTFDASLARPPVPDIPVDQLMRAVEGVRAYVWSRLSRYGLIQDVDDVLQDIRVAAWDGTVRGSYHAFPDVKFDAWVQGIACNQCADHLRRTMATSTVPLVDDSESGWHQVTDLEMSRRRDPVSEEVTGGVWATDILRLVKDHVPAATWEMAMESLLHTKRNGGVDGDGVANKKHWHALTVVRQTALAVKNANDVEPEAVVDLLSLRTATIGSLPSPLFQLIAEKIVVPGLRGAERAAAVAGVAQESGVSSRYVEVQIGMVRNMVRAVEESLRACTAIEGPVVQSTPKRVTVPVVKV